ncbi:uncharacterized protein STEHIDRAFT_111673 [Stereum hirsutum FP-91666 SS1]|uniref:uncharacterized protein n=1 Tax=Stereum hirsutum (strain FP-91666) TaxID=721885 RepID=UPI0004449FB8|nr:uncharacterized protein STEHIDRAFT_111673 [Stereum hirsutum FP-91666 SS1]EIM86147.1 hypothetical protein STEHIDRAFT_111673 [Stereum hirsutum FP-91666 SS1]
MSSSIQPDMFTDPVALSTRGKTRKLPSQTADPSSSTTSTPSTSTSSTPIPFVKPRPKASSSNMTRYSPRSRAGKSTGRKNKKNTSRRTCRLCGHGPFSRTSDCWRHIRKSCPRNPDAKSNPLKCAKCGKLLSRLDALQRHRKYCRGRSGQTGRLRRAVATQAPVVVDEGDSDEDSSREDEDEVSDDAASGDQVDSEYVDDGESMGDYGNYDDDHAEEEVPENNVAGHAEGPEDVEVDDADTNHDDESDAEDDVDIVPQAIAASALLNLHNGVRSSSSATSYSSTPTILATSSSAEDGFPLIAATGALDPVTEHSTTGVAGKVSSPVLSASLPQSASVAACPFPSYSGQRDASSVNVPVVFDAMSQGKSHSLGKGADTTTAAGPIDVGGEVVVGQPIEDRNTSSGKQTPTAMSTPQPESDVAQRELDLAKAQAQLQAQAEKRFTDWDWSPAFPTPTDDSDSDAEDY